MNKKFEKLIKRAKAKREKLLELGNKLSDIEAERRWLHHNDDTEAQYERNMRRDDKLQDRECRVGEYYDKINDELYDTEDAIREFGYCWWGGTSYGPIIGTSRPIKLGYFARSF